MSNKFRRVGLGFFFVIAGLLASGSAMASHMRAAIISGASITAGGIVTGTLVTAWAKGDINGSEAINVYALADTARATSLGSITISNTLSDSSDPDFDVATAPIAFDFGVSGLNLAPGTYVLRRDSCCRISGINNGAPSDIAAEASIVVGSGANSSPVFNSTAFARVAIGLPFSFFVNASDPDGGALTYSFLTDPSFPEYGAPLINGLALGASSGQLSMSAVDTALLVDAGTYAIKVRATDSSGAFSDFDILLISLTTTNVPPVIATPAGGANQTIASGQTLNVIISANDVNATQNVTLQAQGLPANATFTPGAAGNPTSGTLSFTPQSGQDGQTFGFNIVATDNDGAFPLSTTLNMQITVGAPTLSPPTSVPTLSEWSMILLSCLLGLSAIFALRRRRLSTLLE